jgi:hypothetical protein
MSLSSRSPRPIARLLADFVTRQLDPLVVRRGFGEASLLMRWHEIVGKQIADICSPEQLKWPVRGRQVGRDRTRESATLLLRVEPGFGLELQHLTPIIIDRVNLHLGWSCIDRVVIRQEAPRTDDASSEKLPYKRPADTSLRPSPELSARAAAAGAGFSDPALQAAIIRLGENALKGGSLN